MFQSCVVSPHHIAGPQYLFDTDMLCGGSMQYVSTSHRCPQCLTIHAVSWQPTQYSHAGGSGDDPEEKWRRNLSSIANRSFQWLRAVRVFNTVPKSQLRKWLARKVRVWDALVHIQQVFRDNHMLSLFVWCLKFSYLPVLPNSTVHILVKGKKMTLTVCSCRGRKNTSSSSSQPPLVMIIMIVSVT